MKWVALAFVLGIGVPLLALAFRRWLLARRLGVMLLAFDLFNPAHINLISEETYRGDSRGIEICSVDLISLALLIAIKLRGLSAPGTNRILAARWLYFGAAILSLTASADLLKSTYSIWKLLRMFFTFNVLATSFVELQVLEAALMGLALGVVSQGLQALQQKYVYHMVRVIGSQSHPNSLAMIVNLISPVGFSLVLAGYAKRIAWLVFIFAAMCDIFSLSRGGMLMYLLSTAIVVTGSMLRKPTPRKLKIVGGMVLGAILVLAKSAETIIKRFTEAPKESMEARRLFNAAAKMMADAHPFGVGINMFSHTLYYGPYAELLGIAEVDRGGLAHHIYWLTAAETGYVGLFFYLIMLGGVYVSAARAAFLKGVQGEIALGLLAGLTVTYLQGTAEWIARQTTMSYCFWLFAAIACALLENRGHHANEVVTPAR